MAGDKSAVQPETEAVWLSDYLARDAAAIGLPVVALTDHLTSPLAALSSVVLTVSEVDFGAFRSLSATIALATSLAVAVGSARAP